MSAAGTIDSAERIPYNPNIPSEFEGRNRENKPSIEERKPERFGSMEE